MNLNILGCVFMVIAIMYAFCCFGSLYYKQSVPMIRIIIMAVGIVGTVACFFIF